MFYTSQDHPDLIEYPIPGTIYKHYKGGYYIVLFLSKHSENGETLVNYQSLLFGSYHSNPLDHWNSPVIMKKMKKVRYEKTSLKETDFKKI